MLLIFLLPCDAALNLLWLPSYRQTDGDRENRTCIQSTSYRAKILVLHLLELSISVAGAQFHISQNHLEYSVVDGLGEVHVQLVHSSLQTKPNRPLGKGSCQKWVQRYQSGCGDSKEIYSQLGFFFLKATNLFCHVSDWIIFVPHKTMKENEECGF